jgi:hypothetical protein
LDQDPIENSCLTSRSIFSFEMACGFIGFILSAFQSRPAPSWLDEFMKKRTHYDRLGVLLGAPDSQNINKAFVVPSQFDSLNCYADHLPAFIRRYSTVSVAQCLVSTKKGYLGIAEQSVRPGDFIGVFLGCKVPVILRGISGQYQVVRGCFVIGLMQGEVIDELGGGKCVTTGY